MTTKTTPAVAKKNDIQKLQRAIVDGLEDVKAQDIKVFDTERLSALFERVIIASGTSNRQTKALAASVRDAVRDAGFSKPRVEGETNGEWIIVDCGQAVVHIMQPNYRQYYNLEELWGEKPMRLKFGATKPVIAEVAKPAAEPKRVSAKKAAAKPIADLKRSSAAKKGVAEAFPTKAQLKKTLAAESAAAKAPAKRVVARKIAPKTPEAPGNPSPAATKKVAVAAPVKVAAKKASAKTTTKPAAQPAARKTPAKKVAVRKA